MNPPDPRTQAALNAALGHIAAAAPGVAERVLELLRGMASSATRVIERDTLLAAQADLNHRIPLFCRAFEDALREKVMLELRPREDPRRPVASTNWESLSLVDDDVVEEGMLSGGIGQAITHECEWELHDLAVYMGALLNIGRADHERNPLRTEVIGAALYRAIEAVSPGRETRKVLAREFGPVMAKAMRQCYADIATDLKARGVQPAHLSVRGVEGPGSDRVVSGYASLTRSSASQFGSGSEGQLEGVLDALSSQGSSLADSMTGTLRGGAAGKFGSSGRGGVGQLGEPGATDAELMSLIRRLTFMTSRPAGLEGGGPARASGHGSGAMPMAFGASSRPGSLGGGTGGLRGGGLTGLMAVNLIRAHREELRQASSGTLDHMVIEVVGSLFDQILSDSRVPPQMARQIARLQLPVLRVALADPSFFSSRRHPVRRFVNRIASLACAFDDFDDGPGAQFLARVRELVQEIIEGDFDQVEVYAAKLTLLEAFIEEQTEQEVESNVKAATLLDGKESELRMQQRYMRQLRAALAPIAMDDYLRDFLSQVWSQALVLVARRDGPAAERTQRLRRAASELVMSVQPKGAPTLRKAFLMQLPGLMKTLNEGLALIGWPQEAQKEFFGKLLPAHAESLKGEPLTDLDRNMLAKQLEAVFNVPLPRAESTLLHGETAPDAAAIAPHFSDEEAAQVGLVQESSVDWDGQVDIEIELDSVDSGSGDSASGVGELDIGIDIDLGSSGAEPAEPVQGPQLMDHLRVGFAYQMHLKEQWQKVRLSFVSKGRSFFVFTHGKRHQETVSFTARMLTRMCETGRLRAFESSYLLERATVRARKQLAALKVQPTVH